MTRRRFIYAFALALTLLGSVAEAQETVALRFYIVPKIGAGTFLDPIRPKYVSGQAMDYGLDNTYLVGAQVTNAQHTSIASNIDVIAIPADLDSQIGLTALDTVKARLESLRVPSDWVTTNHTWRDLVRAVGKGFQFMERFCGRQGRIFFEAGITLETRMNQLTAAQRNALSDAALSFGLDISNITSTTTVRQALRIFFQQLPSFQLAGQTF